MDGKFDDLPEQPVEEEEVKEDNEILTNLQSVKNPELNTKIEKTQDDLLAIELENLEKFDKPNTLESYFLKKYKLDFIPGELDELREQASTFLEELARHGKLYN
jgi:predicted transcriptional regulator